MKNIELVIPKLNEYSYEQKIYKDTKTMAYNAGYSVNYEGYHYNTGCIDFKKNKWKEIYNKRQNEKNYFSYIKECNINKYIGYVSYWHNETNNIYECDILIEHQYRGKGYSKDALKLLVKKANENDIEYLYDTFEKTRKNAQKLFLDVGFEVYKKTTLKKFNKTLESITYRIKTSKALPNIKSIKTKEDVLTFMKNNIRYGWIDNNNNIHIGNMKNFRKLYRTLSIKEILKYGIGTCIDQVKLMNYLLNSINIKNKMFATRIYEPNDFNKINEEEHMHCFILCYINNKVYHLEHPNWYKIGIYEYQNEKEALKKINDYYIEISNGQPRPITEFYEVKSNITFKEFNNYINSLEVSFRKLRDYKEDYTKLYNWCSNKNVYEWFEQRVLPYEEIFTKYKRKLLKKEENLYIINFDNKDIGLVQFYKYKNDVNIKQLKKYKNPYEYDIFIGDENYINKGIGQKIVNSINNIIYVKYNADCIVLRPFKKNKRAICCYQKCNFKKIYEYEDKDTLGSKETTIVLLNKINRWTFAINTEKLLNLVLEGKKTATTTLYEGGYLPKNGELSIITDSKDNNVCIIKTKKVIVTELKNITWDLAKLEGENKTLKEWQKAHIDYYRKINSNFDENSKILFEIFEVVNNENN